MGPFCRCLFVFGAACCVSAPGWAAKPANDASVANMVRGAKSLTVWAYGRGLALPIRASILPPAALARMTESLGKGGRFHDRPPAVKGDFVVRIRADMGLADPRRAGMELTATFEYLSSTGDLGSGTEWYRVPQAFRVKMAALRKRLPAYWFVTQNRRDPAHDATPMALIDPRLVVDPKVMANRRLTKAQAIGIAQAFRAKIRLPHSAATSAVFPSPPEFDFKPDYNWRPRWKVTFADYVKLDVADATGTITNYENFEALHHQQRAAPTLPDAQLLAMARDVLKATGEAGEVLAPSLERESVSPGQNPDTGADVVWPRGFHGIRYKDQWVRLQMDSASGEAALLTVHFPTPQPVAVRREVTRVRAEAVARAHVAGYKANNAATTALVRKALLGDTEKMVVEEVPWAERETEEWIDAGKPRVAWVCRFASHGAWLDVWVDASTGEVIGDELATLR